MKKINIFLIEDDAIIVADIKRMLERLGYSVLGMSYSGEEALKFFESNKPDLVLIDIVIKGKLNGIETAEIVRTKYHIPVIYLTAYTDEDTVKKAKVTQPYGYINKPVDDRELYSTIEVALYKFQIEQKLMKSEARFRSLFTTMAEGVVLISQTGQIVQANPAAESMFGLNKAESGSIHYAASPWEAIRSDGSIMQPGEMADMRAIHEKKAIQNVLMGLKKPGGHVTWVNVNAAPIFNDSGNIEYIVCTFTDISERKNAEETLKKTCQELEVLKAQLQDEKAYLQEEIKLEHNFEEIIGQSQSIKQVLHDVELAAQVDTTVLILGETGTGKELVARAVHNLSHRKNHPLIKVNCAALPSNLIESELFGHEKGAFTGATVMRRGRFELADGGTIFLDELGELPLDIQAKLLRVLQDNEFERIGSQKTQKVDVRIIAATNRDLKKMTREGEFRRDLYFRLNVLNINIPPLRDRRDDIPILTNHFIKKYSNKIGKKFEHIPQKTINNLQSKEWPGNIRELENVIERAVIFSKPPTLQIEASVFDIPIDDESVFRLIGMNEMERNHILYVLENTKWIIEGSHGAASILKIKPSTLRSRMQKLGIIRPN